MIDFPKFISLISAITDASTIDELHEALHRATLMLGFRQFAMGHHVDLATPPAQAIRLTTYNDDWIAHGMERDYFSDDPIHVASTKMGSGFLWRDVSDIFRLNQRQKLVLTEACGFGLVAGFTVPVHIPGEYAGSCSFAAGSMDGIDRNALPIAQICGTFAFEAARRIMRRRSTMKEDPVPSLTTRQLAAAVLVGRGKTDREIGILLGVSRHTAHEYVEGARRAYGNAQRSYMIVRALFDGQITFADLLQR